MFYKAATLSVVLFIAVSFLSCSSQETPEEEIKEYFSSIEKHVENRNTGRLKKYISDAYTDSYNHSKRDLIRIAAGYLLRHQSVHIKQHIVITDISSNDTRAAVTVDVAVSQEPLPEKDIRFLKGDFHRFKVILEKEGDWLLQSLRWQRLPADEFISGVGDTPPAEQ